MGYKHWRCQPAVVLLLLLAVCRPPVTSAAAVVDDTTLKLAGRDPGIPPDIPKIHNGRDYLLDSAGSGIENARDDRRVPETIGGNLSLQNRILEVISAQRSLGDSFEKPVFQIRRPIKPDLLISKPVDKFHNVALKNKKPSKLTSKIQHQPSDLTSKDIQNPGLSEASQASIDDVLGANGQSLAPRDASYQGGGATGHAALAKSGRELSSVSSELQVPAEGERSVLSGLQVPFNFEVSSQNLPRSPSGNEIPPASKSGISSDPEVPPAPERREKLFSGIQSAPAKQTAELGKKRSFVRKSSIFGGSVGASDDTISGGKKDGSLTTKSSQSRSNNTSDQPSHSPVFQSAPTLADSFSDSNVKDHLKDSSLPENTVLASDGRSASDAEVKSSIVKRSASHSPGVEENQSDLPDQEGPTGHVMHRGIMENFAGDFIRSPVDLQFADDYFNHEPYHYDIYYDDSMNSDFPADEDLDVEEITKAGSTSDTSVQTFPWESDIDANDATEDTDDNLEEVENTLELRLLGPDFQSELGYVLERLANDTQQRSRRHQVPVRHHDPRYSEGISVGVTEGTCPPPVHSLPPGLCLAPPCTSHMMCYPQKMCCFNGCTYTCTEPVQPPPVVDWLEDSDIRLPILDPLNPALPLRFESSPLSYGTGGEETVRLPGGCSLSATKYEELKQFMTAESIQDCLCSGGEVVCVVKSSPSA